MLIDQMMKLQPKLQDVVDYVWQRNKEAKHKEVWFWDTYETAKKMLSPLVGWNAEEHYEQLGNSECWERWIEFIQELSPNSRS